MIVAWDTAASLVAKAATNTIPIVARAAVPVETGLVADLARPGSNMTEPSGVVLGVNAKHLELPRSVVPSLTRGAAFLDATNPANAPQWDEFRTAAGMSGVQAQRIDLYSPGDMEGAFVDSSGAQALSVIAQVQLQPVRERVAELALQQRLPSITRGAGYAEAGLLMTYAQRAGASPQSRRLRRQDVERCPPADLPIERRTVLDFVVNVTTAQALTIPSDLAKQVTKWVG